MISSTKNPRIAAAIALKKRTTRADQRRFLVEGAQGITEALAAGVPLETIFITDPGSALAADAKHRGVDVEQVSDDVMTKLAGTVTPQGLIGIARFLDQQPSALAGEGEACVAMLAACRDPGNAGTVMRSTLAAGGRGAVFCDTSVDIYNPKTVRSSAGALFRLPHVREAVASEAIATFRARGFEIVAASADGTDDLFEAPLGARTVFLFGNEAWGLPAELAALADRSVRIPQAGPAESLNLASAATVCLFEWRRRRTAAEGGGTSEDFPELIAGAAHDLRSPAAAVKSFAATLLARELDPETTAMLLEGIAYDAERMGLVVQQLVDAARLASGDLDPLDDTGDVAAVVHDLAEVLKGNPDHPEIRWEGPTELPATFDRGRLRVAVAAMVELEVWYAELGPIVVDAAIVEGFLTLTSSRGGANVGVGDLESLFVPRAAGAGGGSKLGPAVARSVARAFGGDLTADIRDGALTVTLRVPVRG